MIIIILINIEFFLIDIRLFESHINNAERDSKVKQRRIDAGLTIIAPTMLSGKKHIDNCVYDGSALVG